MTDNNTRAVIEALLFASDNPLTLQQIKNVLDNLDNSEIQAIIKELGIEYEQNNRGMRIIEVAGGFRIVTAPNLAPFLKKLYKTRHADKLSKPALETLAIIAYKQPITRSEIESIRNVNVDGMMANLLDRNLVRSVGRRKAPGRPRVYGTTRQFLEHFGLKSLDELPKIDDFVKNAQEQEIIADDANMAEEVTNDVEETTQTN